MRRWQGAVLSLVLLSALLGIQVPRTSSSPPESIEALPSVDFGGPQGSPRAHVGWPQATGTLSLPSSIGTSRVDELAGFTHVPTGDHGGYFVASSTSSKVRITSDGIFVTVRATQERGAPVFIDSGSRSGAVRIVFEGARDAIPVGRLPLPHRTNWFYGSNPAEWLQDMASFAEVVYPDLYDGIDLAYHRVPEGVKYEFRLAAGSDPARIGWRYEGAQSLSLESGHLVVGTRNGDIVDTAPYAYQDDALVHCPFVLRGPRTVGFACEGWNPGQRLVIDPVIFGTFLGGGDADAAYDVARDAEGNLFVVGDTQSSDFPTVLAYDSSYNVGGDVFAAKLNPAGDALEYSTFLGGNSLDGATAVVVDAAGNAYFVGYTGSTDFPASPGAFDTSFQGWADGFLVKLDPQGGLVYSTAIGSRDFDLVGGIAVDTTGNVYVAGATYSPDFPVTPGAFQTTYGGDFVDGFLLVLNSMGSGLVFSTFLGGTRADSASSVALDADGNVLVAGATGSPNFPLTPGAMDTEVNGPNEGFLIGLEPDGSSTRFGTLLGGSGEDWIQHVLVDGTGRIILAGLTKSADFPTSASAFDRTFDPRGTLGGGDTFVLALAGDGGSVLSGTFFGGSDYDAAFDLALAPGGGVYLGGATYSVDLPVVVGALRPSLPSGSCPFPPCGAGFLARLDSTLSSLMYGTYLNGTILGIDADGGTAILAGGTIDPTLPVTPGAYDVSINGAMDAFVLMIDTTTVAVHVETEPSGLDLEIGGHIVSTPRTLWCVPPTSVTLRALSPQANATTRYVFESWSDGGLADHTVECDTGLEYLARFETQFAVTLNATGGLSIEVDGVLRPTPFVAWCAQGTSLAIVAPEAHPLEGQEYGFERWSDGGPRARTLRCDAPTQVMAEYAPRAPLILWIAIATVQTIALAFLWRILRRANRDAGIGPNP